MKLRAGTDKKLTSGWARQTQMVRAGTMRSELGEMSEALFLTSGFSYETAEEAEARFDGRAEGYTYSRQSNPNLTMLETRMALLEGAENGRPTATGMAPRTAPLLIGLRAAHHVLW